jgi:fructokinase
MPGPVVGIGELLWDVYPDGRKVAGGAPFNFAFHCHQLGHDAVIVSRVGDDSPGASLKKEIRRFGMGDEFITVDRHHSTGSVWVELDDAGRPTYRITDEVAWDYIGDEADLSVNGCVDEVGFRHDVVAICYGTLAQRRPTSRSTIQEYVTDRASMPQALRVFDANLRPDGYTREVLEASCRAADWIKVNVAELRVLSDCTDLIEAMTEVSDRHFGPPDPDERNLLRLVCVTVGADGVVIFPQSGNPIRVPAAPAHVIDTVGAGDAFTAAMVCLHLEGRPLRECARFANYYAARVCEHVGATPRIDRAEVERAAFE